MGRAGLSCVWVLVSCVWGVVEVGGSAQAPEAQNIALHGVHPADATRVKEWQQQGRVVCDGGGTSVGFEAFNDDYCDCDDGSDEPGTSACSAGVFHCRNHGSRAVSLFSSRVNDGVCDCCDGSDEWVSGAGCADTCRQEGDHIRANLNARLDSLRTALEEKKRMEEEAAEARAKDEARQHELAELISTALRSLNSAKRSVEEREANEEAERQRRVREWRAAEQARLEARKLKRPNQRPTNDQGATKKEGEEREGGRVDESLSKEEERAKEEEETVRVEVGADGSTVPLSPPIEEDGDAPVTGQVFEPGSSEVDEERAALLALCSEREDGTWWWVWKVVRAAQDLLGFESACSDDALGRPPTFTCPEAEAARQAVRDASAHHKELEKELNSLNARLQQFTGDKAAFALMEGKCATVHADGYEYQACLFGEASQQKGSRVRLGKFKGWDDTHPHRMLFEGGQRCHNGPERTAKLDLTCGEKFELTHAEETNRCEYELRGSLPLACAPDSVAPLLEELQSLQ